MSSQRFVSSSKAVLKDSQAKVPASGEKSIITPVVPTNVIIKLLGFTLAMIVGPISSYFLSLNKVFDGNSTYAGATAAFTANSVLIGYVIVAFWEDQGEAFVENNVGMKDK